MIRFAAPVALFVFSSNAFAQAPAPSGPPSAELPPVSESPPAPAPESPPPAPSTPAPAPEGPAPAPDAPPSTTGEAWQQQPPEQVAPAQADPNAPSPSPAPSPSQPTTPPPAVVDPAAPVPQPGQYPPGPYYTQPPPQGYPGYPGGQPGYSASGYSDANLAPQPRADEYNHDGFFLRFGLGYSYLRDSATATSNFGDEIETTVTGGGGAFELMMGGTLPNGLVLGGLLASDSQSSVSVDGGATGDGEPAEIGTERDFMLFGPFLAYYPDTKEGWHLVGSLGIAGLETNAAGLSTDEPAISETSADGWGLLLGSGYEFWIGRQWSLGFEGRFTYRNLTSSETAAEWKHSTLGFGLLGEVTLH